jgi:hypothetical protein
MEGNPYRFDEFLLKEFREKHSRIIALMRDYYCMVPGHRLRLRSFKMLSWSTPAQLERDDFKVVFERGYALHDKRMQLMLWERPLLLLKGDDLREFMAAQPIYHPDPNHRIKYVAKSPLSLMPEQWYALMKYLVNMLEDDCAPTQPVCISIENELLF